MLIGSMSSQLERRLYSLEKHLKHENPVLLQVVQCFRDLDRVAYKLGLLNKDESFATRVPWWPLISVLGTFSSGKSSFINSYLGADLQRTGNQAVDDKFTVVCYSKEGEIHTLPGLALDADPRFPFYQISHEIDQVVQGEGKRIDAYLQLKTCPTERLRGKILIDSPGFDADAQRNSTLRITDHIMDLSDLVLVFFDARHPEPGAMKDTLDHLVSKTIHRSDSNKFLFILNQVDCTAKDDNLEDVVAAWQRALAQSGLTAGRFYQIYNLDAANPIQDENTKQRYEEKRAADMEEIARRVIRVEVERAYRIIGVLEQTARTIQNECVPTVTGLLADWRKQVLILDAIVFGLLAVGLGAAAISMDQVPQLDAIMAWTNTSLENQIIAGVGGLAGLGVIGYIHHLIRKVSGWKVTRKLPKTIKSTDLLEQVQRSFKRSTSIWRSVFNKKPAGWGKRTHGRILKVLKETDIFVQNLNDQFTNPSGKEGASNPKIVLEVPDETKDKDLIQAQQIAEAKAKEAQKAAEEKTARETAQTDSGETKTEQQS